MENIKLLCGLLGQRPVRKPKQWKMKICVTLHTLESKLDFKLFTCVSVSTDYKTGVVAEPTVAPAAHPSEVRNVSCTLQWLTSDPDIYVVPLDACGANKHVRNTFTICFVYMLCITICLPGI